MSIIKKEGFMATKKQGSNKKTVKNIPPASIKAPDEKKQTQSSTTSDQPLSADSEKILSALAYPICIIVALILLILSKPQNKIGKFNGYQGLFFGLSWLVIYGVISAFSAIPIIGFIFILIASLVTLAFLVIGILLAVQVYQGKIIKIPVLYDLIPASNRL